MPTTFNWIYLGTFTTALDPTEGNDVAENANLFVGQVYGNTTNPLYNAVTSVTTINNGGNATALDMNNSVVNDQFTTNIGAGNVTYTMDATAIYNATLTYADGTTATITAVVVQSTTGEFFLAPEFSANTDTTAQEAKPIVSMRLDSVSGNTYSGLTSDRLLTGFDNAIVDGTAGADLINAAYVEPVANGTDRIDNSDGGVGVGANDDYVLARDGNDTVFAGVGNDTVYGGNNNDQVFGEAGNDQLFGDAGNDSLVGDAGNDTLYGGAGIDSLYGGADNDQLFGGSENDLLDGGDGADLADGGTGNDTIFGGLGNDTLVAGAGDDLLSGGLGNDSLSAGGAGVLGNNTMFGGSGNDTIIGGDYLDSLYGGSGADSISGGAGNDALFGGDTSATILNGDFSSSGSNWSGTGLEFGPENAYMGNGSTNTIAEIDGTSAEITVLQQSFTVATAGTATLSFDAVVRSSGGTVGTDGFIAEIVNSSGTVIGSMTVLPTSNTTWSNYTLDVNFITTGTYTVRFTEIGNNNSMGALLDNVAFVTTGDDDTLSGGAGDDTIYGGFGNDSISGDDQNDVIYAGAGIDTLFGGTGTDLLFGDADNDILYGGTGADTLYGGLGNDSIDGGDDADSLFGDDGADTLLGGAGNDSIYGGIGADSLFGQDGDDVIDGGTGNDMVDGDAGNDSLVGAGGADTLVGDEGADSLYGGTGADQLYGGLDNDLAFGGDANDLIFGAEGDDTLSGDAGNDTIYGGIGSDTLYGGIGNDSLLGDEGRDFLDAGTGTDFVDGGADQDTIIGGIGQTVTGGSTGTDLDVLDLTAWGKANTNIIFDANNRENGTVEFLDGTGAVIGTMTFTDIETVVPCFTAGSLILTPFGAKRVEDLQVGDLVLTRDNGLQPIRWVGRRDLSLAELVVRRNLRPVLIKAGALGLNTPSRDMMVSPQHRMLIEGARPEMLFGESEVLVAAAHLVGLPGIQQALTPGISYIHLMFDQHEIIHADGCWSESFQPGAMVLSGLQDGQRQEIIELFPELADNPAAYTAARLSLRRHEAKVLMAA